METRTISRRHFLGLCLLGSAGAMLAACSPAAPTPTPQPKAEEVAATEGPEATSVPEPTQVPPTPVPQTVTISWWSLPIDLPPDEWPHGKWEGQLIEQYKDIDPYLEIEFQPLGWESYEKIVTALTTGTPPNLFGRGSNFYLQYAMKGGVELPIELEQDLKDDLPDGFYEGILWEGKCYIVPWYTGTMGPAINMTVVKEAGAEDLLPKGDPVPSWDYDQWLEFLRKCTFKKQDGNDCWGTAVWTSTNVPASFWQYAVHQWSGGSDFLTYDEKTGQWGFPMNNEQGVNWLRWWQELWTKHKVIPDPRGLNADKAWALAGSNQAAFHQAAIGLGLYRQSDVKLDTENLIITDREGIEWMYTVMPTWQGGKPTYWGGPASDTALMPFKTENPDAIAPTVKFAHWIVNPDNQKFLAQYNIPVRKSVVASLANDPFLQWIYKCWMPTSRMRLFSPCSPQEADLWIDMWQKLYQEQDPKQIADEFVRKQEALTCYAS